MNVKDLKEYNEMIKKVEAIHKSNALDNKHKNNEEKKKEEEKSSEGFHELFQEELSKYKK